MRMWTVPVQFVPVLQCRFHIAVYRTLHLLAAAFRLHDTPWYQIRASWPNECVVTRFKRPMLRLAQQTSAGYAARQRSREFCPGLLS